MPLKLPIIEYLNETRPSPNNLLPKDPIKRAQARAISEIINSGILIIQIQMFRFKIICYWRIEKIGIQPLQNIGTVVFLNKSTSREKRNEWLNSVLDKGVRSIETILKETSGQCCVGDTVSIADLCLVPQVEAVLRVKKAIKTEFELSKFPNIARVNDHLEKMAEFQKAHPKNQPDYKP